MLSIKNNMMAANAARHLSTSYDSLSRSVERLSSGLRINSAKDDAAGLAVRELIRADVAQLNQASRNASDAVSMLQTAEGAMGVMDDLLVRMKELAEQAATGSYSETQRTIMDNEYSELASELTRIAESTKFNGVEMLNSTSSISFHLGSGTISFTAQKMDATTLGVSSTAAETETWTHLKGVASADDEYIAASAITADTADLFTFQFGTEDEVAVDLDAYASSGISLNNLVQEINDTAGYAAAFADYDSTYGVYRLQIKAENSGVAALSITDTNATASLDNVADFGGSATVTGAAGTGNDLTTTSGADAALTALTTAIETKDSYRAKLGYMMNRLEAARSVLDIQGENLLTAESRISDVDVATEMAEMTRNQVLSQAGISMLGQANSMPQMALKLLG